MKLFSHQAQALERVKNFNKCAFYHDMGLGKTFTGGEKLRSLGAQINLVICQKSKIKDWLEHFKKYFSDFEIIDATQTSELVKLLNKKTKKIIVLNYDLVWRRGFVNDLNDFTLLLDESSLIQNDKSKRTKAILKLKFKNIILLSGTPVGGKYENLFTQLKLLGWEIKKSEYWRNFVDFAMVKYGSYTPYIPKINGYKNVDLLKQTLTKYGADFLRTDEVLDLPVQNINTIECDLCKEYKQFNKDDFIKIKDLELVGDTALKKLLYLRKLASCYNDNKYNAFKDLIDSTEDRLIIFYSFNEELKRLKEIAKDKPISIINGGTKSLENYNKYDNSITFIQYQSGAMGLNLEKANKIIYFSLTLSSENFEQSKKRIHRIGQNRPCFYYILLAKNSIDEKIYKTLQKRNDYTLDLFLKS